MTAWQLSILNWTFFYTVTGLFFLAEMFHIVYLIYFIYYIDMDIKNNSAKSIFLTAQLYFCLNANHYFHNVTVGHFVAENSVCDLLLIFMAIFTLFRFFYWNVSIKKQICHLSRFHHGGRGLDGDWWWAGLEHYTPGLKMDPTLALVSYLLSGVLQTLQAL